MVVALPDGSPSSVLKALDEIFATANSFDEKFNKVSFGNWAAVNIYIPQPDSKSSITPPFMEAFIALQKELYQLAALTKTGVADIGQLGDADKNDLLLSVTVTGGSSNYLADLKPVLEGLLRTMVGKMTGKQAVTVIIALAALLTGYWSFSAWLDETKAIKLEELKSKDHQEALQAIHFASEEQSKAYRHVVEILEKQGDAGKRALDVVARTNEALLKAATTTPKTKVNQVEVSRQEAELLRTPTRRKPEQRIVQTQMRVVDINTSDPMDLQIILMNAASGVQHRIKLKNDLFAAANSHALFEALESRRPIWVELAMKEVEGEIKSVQLLRVIDTPKEFAGSED